MHSEITKKFPLSFKQVLLIGSLFIVFLLLIVANFYFTVMKEKTAGYDEAKIRAMNQSGIEQIDHIERFHGEEAYYVVSGESAEGDALFAFVPFDHEQAVTTIEQPEQYTREVIKTSWREQCQDCALTSITPGIVEDTAVWEVKYRINKDTFIYEYIYMEDGSLFEQIQYTQLYK